MVRNIITIVIAATLMVSCSKSRSERRDKECMELLGTFEMLDREPGYCVWVTDEDGAMILDANGTPTPNN
jgi:hypothetical protein